MIHIINMIIIIPVIITIRIIVIMLGVHDSPGAHAFSRLPGRLVL